MYNHTLHLFPHQKFITKKSLTHEYTTTSCTCTQHMKIICVHMNNTWRSSASFASFACNFTGLITHKQHTKSTCTQHMKIICVHVNNTWRSSASSYTSACRNMSWYDRFHWKCYTPKIHRIQKLESLGTNSNEAKTSIWICIARYRERWGAGVESHFQEFNEPYAPS